MSDDRFLRLAPISDLSEGALADADKRVDRRDLLRLLAVMGLGTIAGCGSSTSSGGASGDASGAGGDASSDGSSGASDASVADAQSGEAASADAASADAPSCVLTAEQEEGPFYVPIELIRSDITGGKPGLPLTLSFVIIDTTTCAPLVGAAVDVWHCDDTGVYSDESSQSTSGETFHRGVQLTDASGKVTFASVFPGWYAGRTVHIHIKVHVGGSVSGGAYSGGHVSHTGNVFFPQAINDAVAATAPYVTADTNARTKNVDDNVWMNQGGSAYVLDVSGSAATSITASITLGVNSTATPALIGVTSEGGGLPSGGPPGAG